MDGRGARPAAEEIFTIVPDLLARKWGRMVWIRVRGPKKLVLNIVRASFELQTSSLTPFPLEITRNGNVPSVLQRSQNPNPGIVDEDINPTKFRDASINHLLKF